MYFPASHFSPTKVQKRLNTNCCTVVRSRKKGEGVPSAGGFPRQLSSGDLVTAQRDSRQIGASLYSLRSFLRLPQFPRPAARQRVWTAR